jgi:hypothetical protein
MRKNIRLFIWIIGIILLLYLFFGKVVVNSFPFESQNTVICKNGELFINPELEQDYGMGEITKSTAEIAGATADLKCLVLTRDDYTTSHIKCVNNIPIVYCYQKPYKAILNLAR